VQLADPTTLIEALSPGPASTHILNVVVWPVLRTIVEGSDGSKTIPKSLPVTVIPVPLNATVCGLPAALSLLTNWPVRAPGVAGLKKRPPVALDPAAIVSGLESVVPESNPNSGEVKLKFEVSGPVPVLLICNGAAKGGGTLSTGVETPTATGPCPWMLDSR
jgi:hypothetical protein